MKTNLLMGGIEDLGVIKQKVLELNNCIEQKKTLEALENRLEKSITKKENEISDEVTKVTRQRRVQTEATIDERINSVDEKLKKVQSNKEKTKKKAVIQRIDVETAEHRSEEEELNLGGKSIFKQENIPFLYNNRLFFALFFPRGLGDFGIILLSLSIAFFAIPFGVYSVLFNRMNVIYLAFCYILSIGIFGGLYFALGKTKCKHQAALDRVREMRKKIQESKTKQRKIKSQIRKDKDESSYGLEEFDSEIENLQLSIGELLEQKKKALSDFDNATSRSIKDQIVSSHEDELDGLKAEYSKVYEQNKENLDRLNKLSLNIAAEYEGYLGKDFMSLEKIEQMEEILTAGSAKTIAEAIEALSQKQSGGNIRNLDNE